MIGTLRLVAVVRARSGDLDRALTAAGADSVVTWSQLETLDEPPGAVAVVLPDAPAGDKLHDAPGDPSGGPSGDVRAGTPEVFGPADAVALWARVGGVVVGTRPVTDTLKHVDADGTLLGTADRDRHRYVVPPLVTGLDALRAVRHRIGDPLEPPALPDLLTALAAAGEAVTAAR